MEISCQSTIILTSSVTSKKTLSNRLLLLWTAWRFQPRYQQVPIPQFVVLARYLTLTGCKLLWVAPEPSQQTDSTGHHDDVITLVVRKKKYWSSIPWTRNRFNFSSNLPNAYSDHWRSHYNRRYFEAELRLIDFFTRMHKQGAPLRRT